MHFSLQKGFCNAYMVSCTCTYKGMSVWKYPELGRIEDIGPNFRKVFWGTPRDLWVRQPPPPLRQILDLPLGRTSFICRVTPWWSPIEAWVRSNWKQRILVLIMEIIWDVCVDKTGTAFGTFHASCSDVPARFVPSCSALLNVYS